MSGGLLDGVVRTAVLGWDTTPLGTRMKAIADGLVTTDGFLTAKGAEAMARKRSTPRTSARHEKRKKRAENKKRSRGIEGCDATSSG